MPSTFLVATRQSGKYPPLVDLTHDEEAHGTPTVADRPPQKDSTIEPLYDHAICPRHAFQL